MNLINHDNSPGWTELHRKLANKNNGAKTYSEMITTHYWPIFEAIKMGNTSGTVVTTTQENVPRNFWSEVVFIFLHERKTKGGLSTLDRQKKMAEAQGNRCRTIFIVWDKDWAEELEANGLEAIFLPMAIDKEQIKSYVVPGGKRHYRKIIWFGNMWAGKMYAYEQLKRACRKRGWALDKISASKFNGGSPMSKEETFQKINEYQYGVGVGRCAAEMATLGLKVFCYAFGDKGYLPMTEKEAKFLVEKNMLAREEANCTPEQALVNFEDSVLCNPLGVEECKKILVKELKKKGFDVDRKKIGIIKDKNK